MLLGALLIFGAANNQLHLLPTKRQIVKQLEYENQTQAVAGKVTTIAFCVGCVLLILSGIWKGFRGKPELGS